MPERTRERCDTPEAPNHGICYSHAQDVRGKRTRVKLGSGRGLRARRVMHVTKVVRALRERAGLSMEQAAKLAGWKARSGWQRYEDERLFTKRYLPVEIAERIAKALVGRGNPQVTVEDIMALTGPKGLSYAASPPGFRQVRVIGLVEAGVWREAVELAPEDQEVFPMPVMAGFESAEVFGLRVNGPSMNKLFADGSIACCARVPGAEPMLDDIVVVVARRGPLYETTLKQLGKDRRGRTALYPRSTDPRFQAPVYPDEVGAESVEIIGVVIGKFEPIPAGVRGKRR
jgi:SOS-response transcriptional repressor LexA